jgi:hypothetical protein
VSGRRAASDRGRAEPICVTSIGSSGARDRERGVGKAAFLTAATGLKRHERAEEMACRVCPERPVAHTELRLCQRHLSRRQHHRRQVGKARTWPHGLCSWHQSRYHRDKRPGRAGLPSSWWHRYEQVGRPVPIEYADEAAFRGGAFAPASFWPGQIKRLRRGFGEVFHGALPEHAFNGGDCGGFPRGGNHGRHREQPSSVPTFFVLRGIAAAIAM